MSNIYIAGKLDSSEHTITEIANELESRGHNVLAKWWEFDQLPTPYLENPATSSPAAEEMINAAYTCDTFILLPSHNILGAAIELGAAIASTKSNPNKSILVLNPAEKRQSVFYAHPSVVCVEGMKQLLGNESLR